MPNIIDNFNLQSKKFIDSRQSFKTLAEMRTYSSSSLPEGMISFCEEDKSYYAFKNGNWEAFSGGEGSQGLYTYDEASQILEIAPLVASSNSAVATKAEINELRAMIDALQIQVNELDKAGKY